MEHVAQHERERQKEIDQRRLEIVRTGGSAADADADAEAEAEEERRREERRKAKKASAGTGVVDPVVEAGYSGYVDWIIFLNERLAY